MSTYRKINLIAREGPATHRGPIAVVTVVIGVRFRIGITSERIFVIECPCSRARRPQPSIGNGGWVQARRWSRCVHCAFWCTLNITKITLKCLSFLIYIYIWRLISSCTSPLSQSVQFKHDCSRRLLRMDLRARLMKWCGTLQSQVSNSLFIYLFWKWNFKFASDPS